MNPTLHRSTATQYSRHARTRMNARGISETVIEIVQQYGREIYARGAVYCVVGKREVEAYADRVDLSGIEGVHVLVSRDGWVITTYRNRGFRPSGYRKPSFRAARQAKSRRQHRPF